LHLNRKAFQRKSAVCQGILMNVAAQFFEPGVRISIAIIFFATRGPAFSNAMDANRDFRIFRLIKYIQ
jgi:hypothetical protein